MAIDAAHCCKQWLHMHYSAHTFALRELEVVLVFVVANILVVSVQLHLFFCDVVMAVVVDNAICCCCCLLLHCNGLLCYAVLFLIM